jgi:hypothetical protein
MEKRITFNNGGRNLGCAAARGFTVVPIKILNYHIKSKEYFGDYTAGFFEISVAKFRKKGNFDF